MPTTPFEIVAGAVDAWLAPVGTAFPVINAAPAVAWVKIGLNLSKDYADSGVLIRNLQTTKEVETLGTTGPVKAFREKEALEIELTLLDATAESYAQALNQSAVTVVAGPPAEKTIPLIQGGTVALRALLVRGLLSPYADSVSNVQWDVPLVYQSGDIESLYKKADPIGLKLVFRALQDPTLGFGKLHAPTT